jgi:membrane protein
MRNLRRTGRELAETLRSDRVPLVAAGVAFHWFLAVFPLLFAAIATLTLVARSAQAQETVTSAIQTVVPAGADRILIQIVDDAQSTASQQGVVSIVVAIALALGGASSGMAALIEGLEAARGSGHERSFFARRLMGLVFVLVTLVVAGVGVALGMGVGALARAAAWIPEPVVFLVRCATALVATLFVLSVFYRNGRQERDRRRWVTVGALTAAGLILLASVGFALFVSWFGGSYAKTYGSLASVVVLLLWQYMVAFAVLLGAELNAAVGQDGPASRRLSLPFTGRASRERPKEARR